MNPLLVQRQAMRISGQQMLFSLGGAILCIVVALGWQAYQQYQSAEMVFESQLASFIQQHALNTKRSDTLLNALSQHYASEPIKSDEKYGNFAQGLHENSQQIYAIGIAHLLSTTQIPLFEFDRHSQGYESFKIEAKQAFIQETTAASDQHLAISVITPLTPERSIYLGEDLFSMPDIEAKFQSNTATNQIFTETVQSAWNGEIISLAFKPVYLSDPKSLNAAERHKQVKGVALIIIPTEKLFLEQLQQLFPNQNMTIKMVLQSGTQTYSKTLVQWTHQNSTLWPSRFSATLNPPEFSQNGKLLIEQQWDFTELNLWQLVVSGLFTLLIYSFLVTALALTLRYTRNLQQAQNRLAQIITTSQDAVIVTNKNGYVQVWNPEASNLFGYREAQALGQCIVCLIFENPDQLNPKIAKQEQALIDIFLGSIDLQRQIGKSNRKEVNLRHHSGENIIAEVATSILDLHDDMEISLFIKDITHQRRTEAEIKQLAYFDSLTGLQNRTYFKKQLEDIISDKRLDKFSLIFLDLDGFKQVNDSLGHGIGDELLKVISSRITHTIRELEPDAHICRFGGDEFVLMLGNMNKYTTAQVSKWILEQIEKIVKINDDELQVSASLGIAFYPQHGKDVDTLLRHADTAMYQSKASGKNTFSVYNDAMEEHLSKRLLMEKHLRHAVRLNEFSLVYQPKIHLATGKVVGVEALIRWKNPILGHVMPDEFIGIAEESSLIITIGNWVAQTSITQLKNWQGTPYEDLHVAINVSGVQLEHPHFLETVRQMMMMANLRSALLEIELTERTVMSNAEENIARFNEIRAEGFGLSVDDFGTGYSSLSYLKKFPLNILKIDKSFVDGLPDDDEDISISTAILNLSHNLKMKVVAEGVETEEQLMFLKKLQCDMAQGYFISRPLPIHELELWLTKHQNGFYQTSDKRAKLADD